MLANYLSSLSILSSIFLNYPTYLYESTFSNMKIIKSKYRPTMTDDLLKVCLRHATSGYNQDYSTLSGSIQYKSSELSK